MTQQEWFNGLVSRNYRPITDDELDSLIEFMTDNELEIQCCGSVENGKVIWERE